MPITCRTVRCGKTLPSADQGLPPANFGFWVRRRSHSPLTLHRSNVGAVVGRFCRPPRPLCHTTFFLSPIVRYADMDTRTSEKNAKDTLTARLSRAEQHIEVGNLDRAETICLRLRERHPDSSGPVVGLARIALLREDFGAAASYWQSLIERFDMDAQPFWFVDHANALLGAKRIDEAIVTLERGVLRFPDCAPIDTLLATSLFRAGKHERAIALIRDNWRRFPAQRRPAWLKMLHVALKRIGKFEEATVVLEGMVDAYPNHALTKELQAGKFQSMGNYEQALDAWNLCIRAYPDGVKPAWLLGKAKCLLAMWYIAEARSVLQALVAAHPRFRPAHLALRNLAEQVCDWAEALRYCDLLGGSAEEIREDRLAQGKMLVKLRRYDEAHALADQLAQSLPATSTPYVLRYAILFSQGRLLEAQELVVRALELFPNDEKLSDIRFEQLFETFELREAEQRAQACRQPMLLQHKWKLVGALRGKDALIEELLADWSGRQGTTIRNRKLLMHFLSGWFLNGIKSYVADRREEFALPFVLGLLTHALNAEPYELNLLADYIGCLIALGYDDAAARLIERLPVDMGAQLAIGRLLAWAHARQERWDDARAAYRRVIDANSVPSIHRRIEHLEMDAQSALRQCCEGPMALVPVKDELHNLPFFLNHHRKLGIATFVMVDNGSMDGTLAYLRAQPDVLLYRTTDNFSRAGSGMLWVNELITRHAQGRWCLFIDADEEFIYPEWERLDIVGLCRALDDEGAEGMFAFMLDLYPEHFDPEEKDYAKIREGCRYFDRNYRWGGLTTPPYINVQGGIRQRLFEDTEWLPKTPLIKGGSTHYLNNHHTLPIRISRTTGLLHHYKLADLWSKGAATATTEDSQYVDRGRGCIGRYNLYFSRYSALAAPSLLVPGLSMEMGDSRELVAAGLMRQAARSHDAAPVAGDVLDATACRRHRVVARFRQRDTDPAGPYSLVRGQSEAAGPDAARSALFYCCDPAAATVLYTEHDDSRAVLRHPFMYMAQFETAHSLIEIPFSALHTLQQEHFPNPTFIFSIGRCGSTALIRALADAGVPSVSEPDLPTQIALHRQRIAAAFGDAGIRRLLQVMGQNLAAHLGDEFAVKLRGQCNRMVDDMLDAYPAMKCVFMLRRWDSWATSVHRAFGAVGPQMALDLRRGIVAYHRLVSRGANPTLVWYEDLRTDIGTVLGSIGLARPEQAPSAESDSQAGTSLARERISGTENEAKVLKEFMDAWEHIKPDCLDDYPEVRARLGLQ